VENFVFFPAKELGPTSCLFPMNFPPFLSFAATFSKFEEAKMSKHVNGTTPNEKKRKHSSCESKRADHLTAKAKKSCKNIFSVWGLFY
jgi:hypothetical protein